MTDELDKISAHVETVVQETAQRTLTHLRASYPELGATLTPKFRKPDWGGIFKLDLASDNDVPLNKRGSGVRRLVLLSFFQAEAERKRLKQAEAGGNAVPVIYAVEEPETSQHPENQRRVIEALLGVAQSGEQVLLTTHVPALAGILPVNSIRFVDSDPMTGLPRVRFGTDDVLQEVAETLGVLATAVHAPPRHPDFPQVAVCVEGHTDESALRSFVNILRKANELPLGFDEGMIFWVAAGGSGLHAWVERRYLAALGIPQFYIFDSDKDSPIAQVKPDIDKLVQVLQARANCQVFVSRKREIENYVHPAAIARATGGLVDFAAAIQDLDYCDMEAEFDRLVIQRVRANDCTLNPVDHLGQPIRVRKREIKEIITAFIMREMTAAELRERAIYVADGTERHEVIDWLSAIAAKMVSLDTQVAAAAPSGA